MLMFSIVFLFSMVVYLVLTTGSGTVLLWSYEEIVFGTVFSVFVAVFGSKMLSGVNIKLTEKALSPKRWFLFVVYVLGPFLWNVIKANFVVAYRVITGKINPGIVKITPNLRTEAGVAMLANSITLTPGTLSVSFDTATFIDPENVYTYNDENDPNRFYERSDHYNFAKNTFMRPEELYI